MPQVRGPRDYRCQDVNAVPDSLELRTMRTSDMDKEVRDSVVRLCIDAHRASEEGVVSKLEDAMTYMYWTSVGGSLIREFPMVHKSRGRSTRLADAVILPNLPTRSNCQRY